MAFACKPWRSDEEETILREYASGSNARSIADALGRDRNRVAQLLRDKGVHVRGGRQFSDSQATDVVANYRNGETAQVLATKAGVSKTAILYLLRRCGEERRTNSESHRKLTLNESAFDEINESSAYWIGFLMADGCNHGRRISLGLARVDAGHVDAFRRFLGSDATLTSRISRSKSWGRLTESAQTMVSMVSEKLAGALAAYGVSPRKSATARVADVLVDNRDFWRGAVDGDGSIGERTVRRVLGERRYPVLSLVGSRPLMEQFADFVRTVDFSWRGSVLANGTIFRVVLSSTTALRVIRCLYEGCSVALRRKALRAERILARGQTWKSWTAKRSSCAELVVLPPDGLTCRRVYEGGHEAAG